MHMILAILFYVAFTIACFDFIMSLLAYGACLITKAAFEMNAEHIQYSIMLWTATGVLHFIRTPL